MASFKEIRELLLLSLEHNTINEEEFLLLSEEFESKNPDFPYENHAGFDLDDMDESECLAEFRFQKRHIPLLADVLQIPDTFLCYQRSVSSGIKGLCILLKRLSHPCRYSDLIPRFGRPVPVLSMVSNQVLDHIYANHSHRILNWNPTILNPAALQDYSDAISAQGAALDNCFGFIDGTVRPICRPGEHQRVVYNGHKRVHALKFQCVALPNGLIGNLYGPVGKCLELKDHCHNLQQAAI